MHAIANSPPYSTSDSANEAPMASLYLSRPSQRRSLDSSSNIPIDNRIDRFESSLPTPLDVVHSTGWALDVAQLPVEIIYEIFERFMEDDSPHHIRDNSPIPLVSHTCRSDPTKLGQICSRWRAVVINLPKLWSNILIYNPKPSQIRLTDVWLERSGNYPLNLEMNYDKGKGNYDVRSAAQMLQSFMAHLGRWKRFHLDMCIDLLKPLYAIVVCPHKPLVLESVSFMFCNSFDYPHNPQARKQIDAIWKYFHGCPTLRKVRWSGDKVNRFPKHASSQLTHIHAWFSVSIDDILSFLPQVPHIQELQIESLRHRPKNPISPQLVLKHLRILRIRSHDVAASSFIAKLTCPSLESLQIIHTDYLLQSTQDLQELPLFLHRSKCRLRKLDFRDAGINITDAEMKRCLSHSPLQFLTSLHLWTSECSDEMAQLLSRKSSDGSHEFAPFLENLSLALCERSAHGILATMISSRWYEALDDNYSTPLGHLRRADIFPRKGFGPIDDAFFSANIPY